jgi:2-keto-4-pentenoate hydratase
MTNEQNESAQYTRWAEQQLLDYQNRCPGSLFAKGLSLTVEEGYRLQRAVNKLRTDRGDRIVGYKVGCTSPKIRAQLGIKHCVTGRLYKSEQHVSGVCLKRGNYSNLAIEGELAVILRRNPEPTDFTQPGIPACVSCIMPVIELHNHVMHGTPASAGELIANNAIHAGFITGDATERTNDLEKPQLTILNDGNVVETCEGLQLVETIQSSLQWLQATLKETDEHLQEGQIILTGSILSLIPINQQCTIKIDASPLGETTATFFD